MDYLLKPEKTESDAKAFVLYARDTYGITDARLLAKVVDVDTETVLAWLNEKALESSSCMGDGGGRR